MGDIDLLPGALYGPPWTRVPPMSYWRGILLDVPRNSPTIEHLRAARFADGPCAGPAWIARHPTFVPRLSWKFMQGDGAVEAARLSEDLARGDAAVFCDTSVLDDRLDQDGLWEPLLSSDSTLVQFTSQVVAESDAYLSERPRHPIAKALRLHHPRVATAVDRQFDRDAAGAGNYYLGLLAARRRFLAAASDARQEAAGRPLSASERTELRDHVQRTLGNRAVKLERKASGNGELADEVLVFTAVEYALRTGRDTVVLTRDWDVEEQFFKLMWLVETHYRSMLLAGLYRAEFGRFRPQTFSTRASREFFTGDDNVWFHRDPTLDFVLPDAMRFVPISVVRLTDRLSRLTFGAEQGMYELLRLKARTGGMNTDLLGDRNMHASAPFVGTGAGVDAAVIGRDVVVPLGSSVAVSRVDLVHALVSGERHRVGSASESKLHRAAAPAPVTIRPEPVRYGRLWLPRQEDMSRRDPEPGGMVPLQ